METVEPLFDCEVQRGLNETGGRCLAVRLFSIQSLQERSPLDRDPLAGGDKVAEDESICLVAQKVDASVNQSDVRSGRVEEEKISPLEPQWFQYHPQGLPAGAAAV